MYERKNWIFHPKKIHGHIIEDRTDVEEWLRVQFGFVPIFIDTEVTCKVCSERIKGYDGGKHLQLKTHVEKREELLARVIVGNPDYCEGCPCLMQEDNPWNDMTELVCQLGYAHKYHEYGTPVVDYCIDDDLYRPEECKYIHGG